MTEAQKKEIDQKWRWDFLYDPFQELEMTGKYTFDESNDFIYQYLLKRDILKIDPKRGKEIYQEERKKFLDKTKKSDIPQNLRIEFSKYVTNDFKEGNTYHEKVKIECRVRAVREFLNELVKQGKDIGDFFND